MKFYINKTYLFLVNPLGSGGSVPRSSCDYYGSNYFADYGDDYGTFNLGFDFYYFYSVYNQVTLSSNGYVLFSSSNGASESMPTPSDSISLFNLFTQYCMRGIILIDFASSNDLVLIKNQINEYLNNSFTPTNAMIITFDSMDPIQFKLSYQIILSSDSVSSFLIVLYKYCEYDTRNGFGLVTPGVYYIENGQQRVIQMSNPCISSNVGVAGMWIFQVGNKTFTTTTADSTTISTTETSTYSTTISTTETSTSTGI